MSDTPRRLYLRVILKLLTLTALLFIAYALFSGSGGEEQGMLAPAPLRIDLNTLQAARPMRIEWAGGPLQLLRMEAKSPIHLFYDRGGKLGCPLVWQAMGSSEAPQQPWPGGFRDQCSSTWYRYDGQVLSGQATGQNLQTPPHRITAGDLLEIGVNGDNAAPATPR